MCHVNTSDTIYQYLYLTLRVYCTRDILLGIYVQITAINNNNVFSYFVLRILLQIWVNVSQIQRKYTQKKFDVFLTVQHSIDLFQ